MEKKTQAGEGKRTLSAWTEHCIDVVLTSQRSDRRPRYSEKTLEDYRLTMERLVLPKLGSTVVTDLKKNEVVEMLQGLKSPEDRAKALYVLNRVMEAAETKGQRRKGTNPCKGVNLASLNAASGDGASSPNRPANWRDLNEGD